MSWGSGEKVITYFLLLITGFGMGFVFAGIMLADFTMRLTDKIESKIENYFDDKKKKKEMERAKNIFDKKVEKWVEVLRRRY